MNEEEERGENRRRALPITNLQSIKIDCSLLPVFPPSNTQMMLSVSRSGCDFDFVLHEFCVFFYSLQRIISISGEYRADVFFYCGRMSLGMMDDAVR